MLTAIGSGGLVGGLVLTADKAADLVEKLATMKGRIGAANASAELATAKDQNELASLQQQARKAAEAQIAAVFRDVEAIAGALEGVDVADE